MSNLVRKAKPLEVLPISWRPDRLKKLIADSGVPIRVIAQWEGVPDRANISRILAGHTTPRASTLAAILRAIGKTWADLDG